MDRKQIKLKKSFTVSIRQDRWVIRLYTHKNFTDIYGKCEGICEYNHNTKDLAISFRGPRVSKDTVVHELTHAYMSYHDFSRSKPNKMEERVCEIMGKRLVRLNQLADYIYETLKLPGSKKDA